MRRSVNGLRMRCVGAWNACGDEVRNMTKEELANLLNGREIGNEITNGEASEAQKSGLVVVYGASDDLMEFDGAIADEAGCYEGRTVYILDGALVGEDACSARCKWFKAALKNAKTIKAIWGENGYSWTYKTDIPHATFDVLEKGEKYCRGIVFNLLDVR